MQENFFFKKKKKTTQKFTLDFQLFTPVLFMMEWVHLRPLMGMAGPMLEHRVTPSV